MTNLNSSSTLYFTTPPMTSLMRILTVIVMALPVILGGIGYYASNRVLLNVAGFIILIIIGVWFFMRPSGYQVDSAGLTIRWPVRSKRISRSEILAARVLETDELSGELGQAMRIGIGGLFGGFGYLWTTNRGMVEFYITRQDQFVLMDLRKGKSLLLSVDRPKEFVQALIPIPDSM